MSLEIKYLPQQFRTVYNPVEVVLYETNNTTRNYPGFAYLIDVKDGALNYYAGANNDDGSCIYAL